MTVPEQPGPKTRSFVSDNKTPIFYDAPVPYKHWQLRSLLCSPLPNILYYPVDVRIYSLNTETKERKLITFLPFEPRCISAKYGWICAGGVENGQIAVIKTSDRSPTCQTTTSSVPDGPISPGAVMDNEALNGSSGDDGWCQAEYIRLAELGGSIVNSITMYRPKGSQSDKDVLAVITNNDSTVRLFSLSKFRVVKSLNLEFHTNHASISPDGRFLVVVGDSSQVTFFYLDTLAADSTPDFQWKFEYHPRIEGTTLISTGFSPCSNYCSIASQDGAVAIFDTRLFERSDKSPMIRVIPSSRNTQIGAVRCIAFSPSPWDLLVWAEHIGRITITDVRDEFSSFQTLQISVASENVEQAELSGDPVYPGRPATINPVGDSDEAYIAEEQEISEEMYAAAAALDEEETALPSHPPPRPRGGVSSTLRNVYLPPLALFPDSHSLPFENGLHLPRRSSASTEDGSNGTSTSGSIIRRPSNSSSSLTLQQLQASSNALAQLEAQYQRLVAQLTTPPPRPPTSIPSNSANETTETSAAPPPTTSRRRYIGLPALSTNDTDTNTDRLIQFDSQWHRSRQRQWRLDNMRRRQADARNAASEENDVGAGRNRRDDKELDITGVTWSCDGRKLYVATTTGILEYAVGLRMVFPKFDFR